MKALDECLFCGDEIHIGNVYCKSCAEEAKELEDLMIN